MTIIGLLLKSGAIFFEEINGNFYLCLEFKEKKIITRRERERGGGSQRGRGGGGRGVMRYY